MVRQLNICHLQFRVQNVFTTLLCTPMNSYVFNERVINRVERIFHLSDVVAISLDGWVLVHSSRLTPSTNINHDISNFRLQSRFSPLVVAICLGIVSRTPLLSNAPRQTFLLHVFQRRSNIPQPNKRPPIIASRMCQNIFLRRSPQSPNEFMLFNNLPPRRRCKRLQSTRNNLARSSGFVDT